MPRRRRTRVAAPVLGLALAACAPRAEPVAPAETAPVVAVPVPVAPTPAQPGASAPPAEPTPAPGATATADSVAAASAELSLRAEQARRALEAFVRAHPDDPQATPDALLRLALLTDDPAQELPLLETFATRFADHPRRSAVELERARVHALLGDERAAAHALGLLTCLERAAAARGGAERLRPLPGCAPLPGTTDEERGRALWQLGEAAFEAGALDAASDAYRRALAALPVASAVRPVAGYKLAWSESRAGRFLPALEAVARLLTDGAGALRAEAIELGALCAAEPDWNGDDRPDPVFGVRRPELATWLGRTDAWLPELLEVAGRFLAEAQELAAAVECFELLLARHAGYAHADRVRGALAEARRALRP